ncbi:O-acetyl-ADP-ribose deacetylase [Agromyces cerinus]|uniref:O-acetyl-ADP-ribose deacetylase (Regulator of RNase III), contains Macro domain n=1 Tax=Agromyces cerinus subsp. cerinus TaxID=232089 RepID=A0A1N6HCL8_9MICO|nr:O-acetyl-ADP-ribose deacetylase [Agromyces cerinus]SIO17437.1 O-acetyl-ADP-ribose deacetylase (regulator of RNase III), contains Macro domain [Agromyces cerinus subsp. cerinus]
MPRIELVTGDITVQQVDAIVNAANSSLLGGGGVDGAIHAAGGPEILAECRRLRATSLPDGLPTGQSVATTAGRLHARWVIHTVGPVWPGDGPEADARRALLADAYRNSLELAESLGAASVALPAVSAGVYGWPAADAARVALSTAAASPAPELIRFVLFSPTMHGVFTEAATALGIEAASTD